MLYPLRPFRWASALLMASVTMTTQAMAQIPARRQAVAPISPNLLITSTGLGRLRTADVAVQQQVIVLGEAGWGTGFGVEPFVGRLQFDRQMRLQDQDVFGALAGVYLGRSMRVRGYYWRGTDTAGTTDSKLQSYGGEIEMGIGSGWFIHPFVLAGGGRLDYAQGFTDVDSLPREDQTAWVVGGGLKVRPLNWLEFNVTYRDNLLQPLARDKWVTNSLWTAGVSFRFGGTPHQQSTVYGAAGAAGAAGGAAGAPGNMATFPVPVHGGEFKVVYNGDTLRVRDSAQMGRAIVTGTATINAITDLVSSELAYLNALYPVPFGTKRTTLTPEQADSLTRRIGLRTNGVFDYIMRGQAEAMHDAMKSELTARGVDEAAQVKVLARMDSALSERLQLNAQQSHAIMMRDDSAYARRAREAADADRRTVSMAIGGFSEFYLDGRVSFRSPWTKSLRLAPEAAVGFFGGGVSALVAGNALYYFSNGNTKPYAGLGLGVLVRGAEIGGKTGTSFVVNPIFGVEFRSPSAAQVFGSHGLGYFAELQGVDLFNNTRLVAGITWKF